MIKIKRNKDITRCNTFGMKVQAACWVEYDSVEDLHGLFVEQSGPVELMSELPQPLLNIGQGSNLLFTRDFPGTLLHSSIKYIKVLSEDGDDVLVEVGAGVVMDDFCVWASSRGLWGVENLSYIPGTAGAAAVQNVGAYGVEAKDIIYEVHCFDTVLCREVSFSCDDCGYGYRDSLFKTDRKGRYIVISVVFKLSRAYSPVLDYGHLKSEVEIAVKRTWSSRITPKIIRKVIVKIRREKLPEVGKIGSAGSFFKNPVVPKSAYDKVASIAFSYLGADCIVPHYDMGSGFVKIPAAWLIEQCGWKGFREGNVGVYDRQPLVLVNLTGKASPEELLSLEYKIVKSVKEKFDITLETEVEHVQIDDIQYIKHSSFVAKQEC